LLIPAVWLGTHAEQGRWRNLPIRSREEYERGLAGGEGEQHLHSIARCLRHPEHVYLSHDVAGAWRSVDGGESWRKCLDIGLFVNAGQSIEVDPTDPAIVLLVVDNSWNWLAAGDEGLYRSEDGGDHWVRVLQTQVNFLSARHRMYQHNIAYDPTSADSATPAGRWYAAFHENGLFRSDDGGLTWTAPPASSLSGHASVFAVRAHPTDGRTVYVGTDRGLYASDSLGHDLHALGDLPAGQVWSIEIDPRTPSTIYVTLRGDGLYRSTDAGASFTEIRNHNVARAFMNPGYPDQIYLVGLDKNSLVTADGGVTWRMLDSVVTFPGLARETGWRRWIDGNMCGIVPDPADTATAVAYARSTLFKTTDAGRVFRESATGFTGNAWSWWNHSAAFDRLDPERFAFFCCDVGMRITHNGGKWFEPHTNAQAYRWYQANEISWLGTYAGDFQPRAGSQVMVQAIGNYWDTRLCRTANYGREWELIPTAAESDLNLFVSFHPDDPGHVYAGNKISTDSGLTFTKCDFGAFSGPTMVGMCRVHPDVVYAVDSTRHTVLRSRDRGVSWYEYTRPGWRLRKLDNLPTFAVDPVDSLRVYAIDRQGDLAVFDGVAWRSLHVLDSVDGPAWNFVRGVAIDPNRPEVLYAAMCAPGASCIYRSIDAGSTWEDVTGNLPRTGAGAIVVNPHTGELFRGSSVGTWILPGTGTGVSARPPRGAPPVATARMCLRIVGLQGGQTVLTRQLPYAATAEVDILDIRGRRVVGPYRCVVHDDSDVEVSVAGRLPPAQYLVRLSSGRAVRVMRTTLGW